MGCCQQLSQGNEHCWLGRRRRRDTPHPQPHPSTAPQELSLAVGSQRRSVTRADHWHSPSLGRRLWLAELLELPNQGPRYSSGSLQTSQDPLAFHQLPFLSYLSLCTRQQEIAGTLGCGGTGQDHDISATLGGFVYHNM